MRIITLFAVVSAALAAASPVPSADEAGNTIQLVYHSDTRGYYLPCG
ncbi:MAG: hypothetical protein JSW50_09480 [Candidatus Latescibacterota bacterium]|nr:MAG: hypothetical protein JSW50_09480 [Candidatus Latescibacterota bacterium]